MNKIEELKAKFADLQRQLNECEAEFKGKQVWPKNGDNYWFLIGDGNLSESEFTSHSVDLKRDSIGNMFRTKVEAEKRVEYLKAEAAIHRKIAGRVGEYRPALQEANLDPYSVQLPNNPFGCESRELAIEVAAMPEFKTWLGIEVSE